MKTRDSFSTGSPHPAGGAADRKTLDPSLEKLLAALSAQRTQKLDEAVAYALTLQTTFFFLELGSFKDQCASVEHPPGQPGATLVSSLEARFAAWQKSAERYVIKLLSDSAFLEFCQSHKPLAEELCRLESAAFWDEESKAQHAQVFQSWIGWLVALRELASRLELPVAERLTAHAYRVFTGVTLTQLEWQHDVGFFELSVPQMLAILPESPLFGLAELLA